jgi:hypothetical protein
VVDAKGDTSAARDALIGTGDGRDAVGMSEDVVADPAGDGPGSTKDVATDAPTRDSREPAPDLGASDRASDRAVDGDALHCPPGLFSLGGFPAPQLGDLPSSIAVADLDGDGAADLVVTIEKQDSVSVLFGCGDGSFGQSTRFGTGTGPVGLAVVDVNADGKPDLAVGNVTAGTVSVLMGIGHGAFAEKVDYAVGTRPSKLVAGDFDGDGRADLAVAGDLGTAGALVVLHNLGAGTFSQRAIYEIGAGPHTLATGDLDDDGRDDLAVTDWGGTPLTVYSWGESGTMSRRSVGEGANAVVIGDLDRDGHRDLAWSTGRDVKVALNLGDGTFPSIADYGAGPVGACPSFALTLSDVKGSGNDLFLLNDDCEVVTVLANQGQGRYAEAASFYVGGYPHLMVAGDLDGDGRADLVVSTFTPYLTILLARSDGSFIPDWLPEGDPFGDYIAAAGDLDGDGRLDVATMGEGGSLEVWLGGSDGTLAPASRLDVSNNPVSIHILDVNGDGALDVAYLETSGMSVALGTGDGKVRPPVRTRFDRGWTSVAFSDFDGDGDPDLVATFFGVWAVSIFINRGQNGFVAGDSYPTDGPATVAVGDLNADRRTDIAFILSTVNQLGLLYGRGDGSFEDSVGITTTGRPQSLVVGDVDDDGIADLVVGSTGPNSVGVLLGRVGLPGGLLETSVAFAPVRQVGIGDLDTDGKKDLLFREYDPTLFVLRGQGNGRFAQSLAFPMLFGDPLVLADLDGNGRVDIGVIKRFDDAVRWHVYRNNLRH